MGGTGLPVPTDDTNIHMDFDDFEEDFGNEEFATNEVNNSNDFKPSRWNFKHLLPNKTRYKDYKTISVKLRNCPTWISKLPNGVDFSNAKQVPTMPNVTVKDVKQWKGEQLYVGSFLDEAKSKRTGRCINSEICSGIIYHYGMPKFSAVGGGAESVASRRGLYIVFDDGQYTDMSFDHFLQLVHLIL